MATIISFELGSRIEDVQFAHVELRFHTLWGLIKSKPYKFEIFSKGRLHAQHPELQWFDLETGMRVPYEYELREFTALQRIHQLKEKALMEILTGKKTQAMEEEVLEEPVFPHQVFGEPVLPSINKQDVLDNILGTTDPRKGGRDISW